VHNSPGTVAERNLLAFGSASSHPETVVLLLIYLAELRVEKREKQKQFLLPVHKA
jgi:hypothetical protein